MYNWIFGVSAIAFWALATLLYLWPYIARHFKAWRGRRAALAAARAKQRELG